MRNKNIFILFSISIFPVVAGWLLFYFHQHFNLKMINNGTLLNPPVTAVYLNGAKPDKLWHIIYVKGEACDAQCDQLDKSLLQVKNALGKEGERVQVQTLPYNAAQLTQWQKAFAAEGYSTFTIQHKVYLIDPIGNIFMYYADTMDSINILKDLKRVLEVSQIG